MESSLQELMEFLRGSLHRLRNAAAWVNMNERKWTAKTSSRMSLELASWPWKVTQSPKVQSVQASQMSAKVRSSLTFPLGLLTPSHTEPSHFLFIFLWNKTKCYFLNLKIKIKIEIFLAHFWSRGGLLLEPPLLFVISILKVLDPPILSASFECSAIELRSCD